MKQIDNLLNLFVKEYTVIKLIETEAELCYEILSSNISIPSETNLINALTFLKERDSLTLDILIGSLDTVSLYTNTLEVTDFFKYLSSNIEYKEQEDKVNVRITVYKRNQDGILTIYSIESLSNYWNSLSFSDILSSLTNAYQGKDHLVFESIEGFDGYCSETIFFKANNFIDDSLIKSINDKRKKRIELINSACHYGNSNEYSFIPNDFNFINKSEPFEKLDQIFYKLKLIYSLISICDVTYNNENGIFYKLNGYKSISGTINYRTIASASIDEYYKIYEWIYEGGNLNDKIGLARNIISIHLESKDGIELNGSPFNSIKSSFEVYLKQNIKQYIEIRNKVSDQLLDFSNKANHIADGFASNFQKSVFAFFSFFASVIIIRVISKGEFTKLLSNEASIISFALLCIVGVFLVFSRWEIFKQRERFIISYQNLKERFKDLLVEGDIDRILNKDKGHIADLKFIDEKIKTFTYMWIIVLSIFFFSILILTVIYNEIPIGKIISWMNCCNL